MYKDAGFAAPLQTAVGFDDGGAHAGSPARNVGGLNWRHAATVALLLVTLPAFLLAAALSLPVMVLAAGASACRSAWRHWQAREHMPAAPLR